MKKIFKGLMGVILTGSLVFNAVPALAATSIYCDNDSLSFTTYSDKASNGSLAFAGYSDGKANHMHGDYRISSLVTDDYRYHYEIPVSTFPTTYKLEVYLNDAKFTNRNAHYYFGTSYIGHVNQYTALAGWNYVGSGSDWSTIHVQVSSQDFNNNNSTQTGADEIHIYE